MRETLNIERRFARRLFHICRSVRSNMFTPLRYLPTPRRRLEQWAVHSYGARMKEKAGIRVIRFGLPRAGALAVLVSTALLVSTAVLVSTALLVSTAGAASAAEPIAPLPTGTGFDYQLGGSYAPPVGVGIVTRDSTESPAAGLYSICYVNGFQTQDGDRSFWLHKHPTLVLRYRSGTPVTDPGWPGELILNTSTSSKRAAIARILGGTITSCAAKGFQAVEFDNLDSWTRSHHKLSKAENVAMATLLVTRSHRNGLAAGQKNTTELGTVGRDRIGFDFAVAEECYRYNECASYTDVYGANVLDIEYTDNLRGTFAGACKSAQIPAKTILRDRDLTTPASRHYVYQSC
jgi:hypothetical protein